MRLLYSEGTDCPGATEPNFMNGDSSCGSMMIGSPKSAYTTRFEYDAIVGMNHRPWVYARPCHSSCDSS